MAKILISWHGFSTSYGASNPRNSISIMYAFSSSILLLCEHNSESRSFVTKGCLCSSMKSFTHSTAMHDAFSCAVTIFPLHRTWILLCGFLFLFSFFLCFASCSQKPSELQINFLKIIYWLEMYHSTSHTELFIKNIFFVTLKALLLSNKQHANNFIYIVL